MNRDRLIGLMGSFPPGRIVECHPSLDSTNDRARELLETFGEAADGAVVIAEKQTRGRGRQGRFWSLGAGKGLAVSVAVWPRSGSFLECLPLAGALAVLRALAATGVDSRLKWPNDVVVHDAKLAGVLVESRFSGDSPRGCVVGIGVNLNEDREDFPADLNRKASSVRLMTGREVDRERFAALLVRELDPLVQLALADSARLAEHCRPLWCHEPNEPLKVVLDGATLEGRFAGIGPGGELLLAGPGGLREIHYGDVVRLKRGERK
ncbi:MAG: biotin--[acetyl-CoA-carboxylase] ligase [Acidobacteriota bacterium]|jgi:BirA family transcriptional regulator, biotin operon repressor / biotin---[acetyl-CoA-carboxylase] ligase